MTRHKPHLTSSSYSHHKILVENSDSKATSSRYPPRPVCPKFVSVSRRNCHRILKLWRERKRIRNRPAEDLALGEGPGKLGTSMVDEEMIGNTDTLGTDLLESLSRMAPSKEEEFKLKEYKNDSPFKLGPAERFLKAMVDIPFAFKRMDAMLYIANFDSEVVYLRKSFEILEVFCQTKPLTHFPFTGSLRRTEEQQNVLKLLEAVLMTGNRMNVGTNRGDAHAFKLDTLLKLVHVKGTDGKTTLLHFVVQEIIRAKAHVFLFPLRVRVMEKLSYSTFRDDTECRKHGLQVVAGISGELTNVKKAAAMDSEVLSSDISKLARGIGKVGEVVRLNEAMGLKGSSQRFSESMNGFLKKAEEEIIRIQAQESVAISLVKEITEYFHGNSAKEEAHPFRIFMVVRIYFDSRSGLQGSWKDE
ncbi:hypothetical protein HHK36_033120 [Tetracentron sinense]|uniref:Formin-like protein n=1 Tax=Tetracentron sinense TaxID=13715 RepID=A0A834Y816_TETSI|nr:hypothetical protein HHK36_033120 [Tetracentron sinense]